MRRRPTEQQRQSVIVRAHGQCEYCHHQQIFSSDPFEIEHIIPVDQGGTTTLDNLALACRGCNSLKRTATTGIDPATGEMASLFHPRLQPWADYFLWSQDRTQIVALTPTGRATVESLQLNRLGLRNLRRALILDGSHPPV